MKQNTFQSVSIEPIPRTTAEQEIEWIREVYDKKLDFYLIRRSLISAYEQRLKLHPRMKNFLTPVINYLKNY
jgi:hypothetical protein